MSYVDNGDDELDYEDEEYPETGQTYGHGGGAIAALAEDELEEEDDYEDLYQDVDVGFFGNSGVGNQAPRFPSGEQNGAEGYGEEDYGEEYEGVGRDSTVVEEESYPEEDQAYLDREELVQGGRNVRAKIEGEYEEQDYAEEPIGESLQLQEPKEEELEDVEEIPEDSSGPAETDTKPIVTRPTQVENTELNRSSDYGARAAPIVSGAAIVKTEERDYSEPETQVGRAAGAPIVTLLKPKVEVERPAASSQQRTESQLGKPSVDRASKGAGPTISSSGGWVNGSGPAASEGGGEGGRGGARGEGGVRGDGGATGSWPSSTGKGGGPAAGAGGSSAGAIVSVPQPPKREAANTASDYMGKHAAGHQQHETGGIMLFVGELHWWTTDAELEAALSEYGRVKNIKFFEEKASGRSKGYCQVEFYEPGAARVCKEKMDGRVFNDRPCVVAFASPQTIKQLGAAQVGKNQSQAQGPTGGQSRGRGDSGSGGRGGGGGSQMGEGGRGYGREKMMMGGRGGGPGERGRGSNRGRGGNIGGRGGGGGAPFGQGPPGPMGGGPGGMMPPQGMMGGGFDPAFGPPMGGRGGGYGMGPGGGFGPRAHPFGGPGMGPPFPAMGPGLPGVAPHVNPAFFGRANGNGPGIGMEGPGWGEGPMPGWVGDDHERRMVYGDEMGGPDYGYPGEMGPDRIRAGPARERERVGEGDWTGADRRRREDRGDGEWGGERHRERGTRDEYWEREQGREKDKDWPERERVPRAREKSRAAGVVEEEERPRSRDEDFGKRRRMVADRKIER